jgi:hypothetical protein
VPINTK